MSFANPLSVVIEKPDCSLIEAIVIIVLLHLPMNRYLLSEK